MKTMNNAVENRREEGGEKPCCGEMIRLSDIFPCPSPFRNHSSHTDSKSLSTAQHLRLKQPRSFVPNLSQVLIAGYMGQSMSPMLLNMETRSLSRGNLLSNASCDFDSILYCVSFATRALLMHDLPESRSARSCPSAGSRTPGSDSLCVQSPHP